MTDSVAISMRVRQVVSEICDDLDIDRVHPEHQLEANYGFDSFERVELLNTLEDEFNVCFPHPQDRTLAAPTTTVRDLIEAVEQLLSAKGTPA